MKNYLFLLFCIFYLSFYAQISIENKENILSKLDQEGNQLTAFYLSTINEDSLANFIFYTNRKAFASKSNSIDSSFQIVSAFDYLSKISKNYDVIIINEAHHRSYDRILVEQLLKILSLNDYQNYCMEAYFKHYNIAKTPYPTKNSGFYIQNPAFANCLRTALQLNYKLFGYECDSIEICPNPSAREEQQALNLKQIIENNKGKTLVHCGFDHARIDTNLSANWGRKAMAKRLIEKLPSKKILCIDQIHLSDKIIAEANNPFYQEINEKFNLTKASLLIKNNQPYIDTIYSNKRFHLQIVQPLFSTIQKTHSYQLKQKIDAQLYIFDEQEYYCTQNKYELIPLAVCKVKNGFFQTNISNLFNKKTLFLAPKNQMPFEINKSYFKE